MTAREIPAPRPRRYLFLALACTSLFAVVALLVDADTFVVRLDERLISAAGELRTDHPAVADFFWVVTDLGTGRPLWVVGTAAVVLLAIRREGFRVLVWTAGLLACRPVTPFLKGEFGRPRPENPHLAGLSFPSGHAFGSAVVYGMLALALLRVLYPSRWRWVVAGALWLFVGLVAVSRPVLGVHYPSDVLAGMSLGLGWGFYWAAVADWRDLRRIRGSAERVEETQDPS